MDTTTQDFLLSLVLGREGCLSLTTASELSLYMAAIKYFFFFNAAKVPFGTRNSKSIDWFLKTVAQFVVEKKPMLGAA